MSFELAAAGSLESLAMRRASITEKLTRATPDRATLLLDTLFVRSASGSGRAQEVALAVATWIARSDRPELWCEGRRIRAQPDPLLARLREVVSAEQTPLAAHVLLQPPPKRPALSRWADGIVIECARPVRGQDFWRALPRFALDGPRSNEDGELVPLPWTDRPFSSYLPAHFGEAFLAWKVRFRGASTWLRLQAILSEPRLRPRFVVAMASTHHLPPEVAFAIALHDKWVSLHEIRVALVYNRATPAALVAALLPTVGAGVARVVAERAREPSLIAAAVAFSGRAAPAS